MISCSISFFGLSIAIGISIRINVSISCIRCISRNSARNRLPLNSYLYIYLSYTRLNGGTYFCMNLIPCINKA